jgi:prefoldin subunit 5
MRTPEYLETGKVPEEFLIGGLRPGRGGKTIYEPLGNKTPVDELIRIRGDLLGWARDSASSTGQRSPSDARMFSMLAESILDDFSQLNTKAYDRARQFSRSLNDNFTRSYARDITAVTKAGAERIPPEVLVSRMFGRDSDLTFARMEQIEDAVGLFGRQYDALTQQLAQLRSIKAPSSQIAIVRQQLKDMEPLAKASKERVISVTDAMERVLRMAMTDPTIVNLQTGRVNQAALANWMARNQNILDKFGSLKNDLTNALDAETAFAALKDPNSAAARQLRNQEAFASVLVGGEKPTAAVSDILASRTPVAGVRQLIEVVNRAGPNRQSALDGLKSSILEWAYTKAGGTGNQFSVKAFDDNLFRPLAPGQPSIINVLRTQGLMTADEVKNLRRLLIPMRRIEEAKGNRAFLENVMAGGNPLDAFAVRFLALHLGSNAIPSGPGSLAAASAVSNTAQQLFNQMPRLNALAALKEAAADPKVMAALLRKGRTDEEKLAFLREARDRLSGAGILMNTTQRGTIPALNVTEEQQRDVERRREEARRNRMRPPAPTTRGMPGLPSGGGGPAPGGPPPTSGGPQSSQSRMMLQQLFPNDAITGAAAMQGGAPPMPG